MTTEIPSTDRPQTEAMQHADAAFFKALLDRDLPALEALLAEDFLIIDVAAGSLHGRPAFLEAIGGGAVRFEQIRTFPEETVVRLAGAEAGIVVGRTAMSFRGPDGAATEVASRYTHVFRCEDGDWRLLSAQGTAISE